MIAATSDASACERLAAMERTEDGFELAEYDLSLRREGDILGNRQSGASVLKLVNVIRDGAIIEAAHADAREFLEAQANKNAAETRIVLREIDAIFASESQERSLKKRGGTR